MAWTFEDGGGLYGNAGLARPTTPLAPFFTRGGYGLDSIPLGIISPTETDTGAIWNLVHQQGHGLLFGANRSGKGTSVGNPALLSYAGSSVVIDVRGDLYWTTAIRRREMGHRVILLDPAGEVNKRYASRYGKKEHVNRYNPLYGLNPRSRSFSDDIVSLQSALIYHQGSSDPYWDSSAGILTGGNLALLVEYAHFVDKNPLGAVLADFRHMFRQSPEKVLAFIQAVVNSKDCPTPLAQKKLRRFLEKSAGKEVASIRLIAEEQTEIFDSPDLEESLQNDPNPFSFEELATGKMTVYCVCPVEKIDTWARWLRLVLVRAIDAINAAPARPSLPVLFFLDESAAIGHLPVIERSYGVLAGQGIRLFSVFQDINQLERIYPNSAQTMINNCSVVQVLNARDPHTSEYFSRYLGSSTWSLKSRDGHQQQYWDRPVMLPQEIRAEIGRHNASRESKQLIIFPGDYACLAYQNPYFEDERWNGFYRPLPGFEKIQKRKPQSPGQASGRSRKALRGVYLIALVAFIFASFALLSDVLSFPGNLNTINAEARAVLLLCCVGASAISIVLAAFARWLRSLVWLPLAPPVVLWGTLALITAGTFPVPAQVQTQQSFRAVPNQRGGWPPAPAFPKPRRRSHHIPRKTT